MQQKLVDHPFSGFFGTDGAPRIADIEDSIASYGKAEILDYFKHDSWQQNIVLNIWEQLNGVETLESYPWNITLPIADVCNARCNFCTSWLAGTKFLKPEDVERYEEVLPFAYHFGYQGHGEPLANPHIGELLNYFGKRLDPRCFTYTITNGVYLEKLLEDLLEARVNVLNVSLNATTPDVHDSVMGLGPDAFGKIIKTLRKVSNLRETGTSFTISMVLTADNIHQAADFVRLGNDIGASTIYLRSLMPSSIVAPGLNYHLLAPRNHPDFDDHKEAALRAIENSKVRIEAQPETWSNDSVTSAVRRSVENNPPPYQTRSAAARSQEVREYYRRSEATGLSGRGEFLNFVDDLSDNPYDRTAPFSCKFVYYNLISTELTWRLSPCCYMAGVPGHKQLAIGETGRFHDYWNSPAYVNLRKRLQQGPLFQACATCPMQG